MRTRRERRWLLLALLAATALLSASRLANRAAIDAAERARLDSQARSIEQNLARQLIGVNRALIGVRIDIAGWPLAEREGLAEARLKALCDALPGLRTMTWLDADGRIVASSVPALVGRMFAQRAFFRDVRDHVNPATLYVSEPYLTSLGVYSLNLSLALTDSGGRFAGVVAATLDPAYFDTVLGSALYAPDMWAAIAHGNGQVLLYSPADAAAFGDNLAQPGSLFVRHRDGGQRASVMTGTGGATGAAERVMAQRTLQPPEVPMDRPLVLAVSRDVDAVFAGWRRQTWTDGVLFAGLALAAWFTLLALQRRRRQLEDLARVTSLRQAADSERVALALRGADLALWDAHLPSRRGVVNERWYSMLGYASGEVAADESGWHALLHPEDRDRVLAAQQDHVLGRTEAYEATYRLRHRDGHWVWVLDRGSVVERDPAGNPLRMVGTHLDVTQRMEADQALRRSEESLATTLHSIGDAVIATDPAGVVTRINATASRLTGWSIEQALGQPLTALFRIHDADTRQPLPDPVTVVLRLGEIAGLTENAVLESPAGGEHQISYSAAPIRSARADLMGVVLVFSDVTEHRRTLQALRDSEAQLSTLAAALPGPVARLDLLGRYLFSNAACERWFGHSAAQMQGRNWRDVMAPEVQAVIEPQMALTLGGRTCTFDVTLPTLAGPRVAMMVLVPDRDDGGAVRGCFVIINDITDRKRVQEELQRSEDRLRMASRMARLGGWRLDLPDSPPTLSPELLAMLDFGAGKLVRGQIYDFVAPGHRELLRQRLERCESDGQPFDVEVDALSRNGRALHLRVLGEAVRDSGGRICALQGAVQDVTDQRQAEQRLRALEGERQGLERQLREAQKMESIGTLAGGIAHDFNNILPAILGNVALARAELPPAHPALAALDQINTAGLRARNLVQQILTFSRRHPNALQPQPLRPVVEETLALLRATLPAGVRLDTALAEQTLVVEADATQLQQVLMNLCTNAWHALPEGRGRIEVGLQALDTAPALAPRTDEMASGPCAHLWVRDDGVGMDAATRDRIFDPFFTTKPVGRGTGLGLSMVHGIVRSHRGAIGVDSVPGRGSTFHLYLPLLAAPDVARGAGAAAVPAAQGSGQRLLYVDDDEVMRLLVERLLGRAGYAVDVAADAASALARVAADPDRYQLVISDFNMPEMSGLDLALALARLRPGLPMIISSGYLTDTLRVQARAAGVRALLRKENTLEKLPALVNELLSPVRA